MTEKLDDLFEGVKERLKSNFLLTFIVIWLIHNWEVVFTIFNFDSFYIMDSKIARLQNFFDARGYWHLWALPILFSLTSIIVYYFLSSISEVLFIGYQNIRKSIYNKWENKKIKTIEEYDERVKENKELQNQIAELERRRENLLNQNTRLEDEIGQIRKNNGELSMNYTRLAEQGNKNEEEVRKNIKIIQDLNTQIQDYRQQVDALKNDQSTISHSLAKVFGTNEWELQLIKEGNSVRSELFYLRAPDVFVIGSQNIILTDIKVDLHNRIIMFDKSNKQRNYQDLFTALKMTDDNYYEGIEGSIRVEYRRVVKPPQKSFKEEMNDFVLNKRIENQAKF